MALVLAAMAVVLVWGTVKFVHLARRIVVLMGENAELRESLRLHQERLRGALDCITIDASRRPMRHPEVDLEWWDLELAGMRAIEKRYAEPFSSPVRFSYQHSFAVRRNADWTWEMRSLEPSADASEPSADASWKPLPERLVAAFETARDLRGRLIGDLTG